MKKADLGSSTCDLLREDEQSEKLAECSLGNGVSGVADLHYLDRKTLEDMGMLAADEMELIMNDFPEEHEGRIDGQRSCDETQTKVKPPNTRLDDEKQPNDPSNIGSSRSLGEGDLDPSQGSPREESDGNRAEKSRPYVVANALAALTWYLYAMSSEYNREIILPALLSDCLS